jgi:hypothetical protein
MTTLPDIQHTELPTLDRLQAQLPENVDAAFITKQWFSSFTKEIDAENPKGIVDLCLPDVFWRDILALTWDFRTFYGRQRVLTFLNDRLTKSKPNRLTLKESSSKFLQPSPDLAWIVAFFSFETDIGEGSGIFYIVPTASGQWLAYGIFTNLENLLGHPESIGPLREQAMIQSGRWLEKRRKEVECDGEDQQPKVKTIYNFMRCVY